ncbi:hypothetical protein ACXZ1M_20420 [Duganella sp. PWIR1]
MMALDNHPRLPREDQWRPIYVEDPPARPDLVAAIYLQRGSGPDVEIFSGVKADSNPSPELLDYWFFRTFERAMAAAHSKTIAEQKAQAATGLRW